MLTPYQRENGLNALRFLREEVCETAFSGGHYSRDSESACCLIGHLARKNMLPTEIQRHVDKPDFTAWNFCQNDFSELLECHYGPNAPEIFGSIACKSSYSKFVKVMEQEYETAIIPPDATVEYTVKSADTSKTFSSLQEAKAVADSLKLFGHSAEVFELVSWKVY